MTPMEILTADQPRKPWKAFAPTARALADVLGGAVWPNDGPVHLRGRPFIEPMPAMPAKVAYRSTQFVNVSRARVLAILETCGDVGITCTELSARVRADKQQVNGVLHTLKHARLVEQVGQPRSPDARWRLP